MITIIIITATKALGCIYNWDCVGLDVGMASTAVTIGMFELVCEGLGIKIFARRE